jgi:predicted negative regulator of RcsB-dependent stress response
MLPLASSSGIAIISVVVLSAALLLGWLLRSDRREEAADEQAPETSARDNLQG